VASTARVFRRGNEHVVRVAAHVDVAEVVGGEDPGWMARSTLLFDSSGAADTCVIHAGPTKA
jgi:hypothetical protein